MGRPDETDEFGTEFPHAIGRVAKRELDGNPARKWPVVPPADQGARAASRPQRPESRTEPVSGVAAFSVEMTHRMLWSPSSQLSGVGSKVVTYSSDDS